jgi:hypothetical protein
MNKLEVIGQIADLKETDYKNTLAIACIIELLIEKGIISRNDISKKAYFLENLTLDQIKYLHSNNN